MGLSVGPTLGHIFIHKVQFFPSGCPCTVHELLSSRGRSGSLERSGLCSGLIFTLQFLQYERRFDASME